MAVITTGSFAKAIYPGVNAWWGSAYEQYPKEFPSLFDIEKSTRNYEEDVGVSGVGLAPVKTEGGSISYDQMNQTYVTRYTHIVYGIGMIITREMIEDDQYDVVGKMRAKELAFSIRQTQEVVSANVYNRAFSASYLGGDGVAMCSASHPTASGNQSNTLSV